MIEMRENVKLLRSPVPGYWTQFSAYTSGSKLEIPETRNGGRLSWRLNWRFPRRLARAPV